MPDEETPLVPLQKGAQTAFAELRQVEDVGLELRFIWNGELAHSHVYRDVQELMAVANAKREELEGR